MNSIVLMMQYFSRTALIPYACVYPVIVTASARLQKKTSICFLSDIKMNDEHAAKKADFTRNGAVPTFLQHVWRRLNAGSSHPPRSTSFPRIKI